MDCLQLLQCLDLNIDEDELKALKSNGARVSVRWSGDNADGRLIAVTSHFVVLWHGSGLVCAPIAMTTIETL